MKKRIDKDEIAEFLKTCGPDTKIYLGCDSERFKIKGVWHADFILVCVVHIDGIHGCKVFAEVHRERDFDQVKSRPFNRMMSETYKVAALYQELKEILYDYEVMIHLDINPKEGEGSNVAYQAACGYIKGTCNVVPFCKPDAWAASFGADRAKDLQNLEPINEVV